MNNLTKKIYHKLGQPPDPSLHQGTFQLCCQCEGYLYHAPDQTHWIAFQYERDSGSIYFYHPQCCPDCNQEPKVKKG